MIKIIQRVLVFGLSMFMPGLSWVDFKFIAGLSCVIPLKSMTQA